MNTKENNIPTEAEYLKRQKRVADVITEQHKSKMKLKGIDFNGTMISATGEDQAGLVAVWSQYKNYLLDKTLILPSELNNAHDAAKSAVQAKIDALEFPPVYFTFSNGNKLVIDEDNIEALEAVWKPFRMSFFPMPTAK